MTPTTVSLLCEIEAFLERHPEITPTAFGIAAVNDGHLLRDLRKGLDLRASRIDRCRAFMAAHDARPRKRSRAA